MEKSPVQPCTVARLEKSFPFGHLQSDRPNLPTTSPPLSQRGGGWWADLAGRPVLCPPRTNKNPKCVSIKLHQQGAFGCRRRVHSGTFGCIRVHSDLFESTWSHLQPTKCLGSVTKTHGNCYLWGVHSVQPPFPFIIQPGTKKNRALHASVPDSCQSRTTHIRVT